MVDQAPLCPGCKDPMRLTRTIPKAGPLPELHVFECMRCSEVDSIEAPVPRD